MEARSDNSPGKSSKSLLPHTGEGVVIDIGTGDGRFVSALAKANPNKFYVGIDANVKPLQKPSMKATRKPAKGGLANALFVQAAAEELPTELDGTADEIHIHFPWGSVLKAVTSGDERVLRGLRRIAAPECLLEVVIGIDPERDRSEIQRLKIPDLNEDYLRSVLLPLYGSAGFEAKELLRLDPAESARLETSWAKRLQGNAAREVLCLIFEAT